MKVSMDKKSLVVERDSISMEARVRLDINEYRFQS